MKKSRLVVFVITVLTILTLIVTCTPSVRKNMKLGLDNSDATVADLITDGCNMGIKSLNKYLNEYEQADSSAKRLCKELTDIEEQLCTKLERYL